MLHKATKGFVAHFKRTLQLQPIAVNRGVVRFSCLSDQAPISQVNKFATVQPVCQFPLEHRSWHSIIHLTCDSTCLVQINIQLIVIVKSNRLGFFFWSNKKKHC